MILIDIDSQWILTMPMDINNPIDIPKRGFTKCAHKPFLEVVGTGDD